MLFLLLLLCNQFVKFVLLDSNFKDLLDSIAVSVFGDIFLSLTITESEVSANKNLMMCRAGLSEIFKFFPTLHRV